jgi:hypothetical protein
MSQEIKKDASIVPAEQPVDGTLPATQEIAEIVETDLDDVTGGADWCILTSGCGNTCGATCGNTKSGGKTTLM